MRIAGDTPNRATTGEAVGAAEDTVNGQPAASLPSARSARNCPAGAATRLSWPRRPAPPARATAPAIPNAELMTGNPRSNSPSALQAHTLPSADPEATSSTPSPSRPPSAGPFWKRLNPLGAANGQP